MLNENEKKYWKKVYMYFGMDFHAWLLDNEIFTREEYHDLTESGEIRYYGTSLFNNEYIDLDLKYFTQKFIDEISK